MAIEKIMGSETELGITTRVASGFDPVGSAIFLINALPGERVLAGVVGLHGREPASGRAGLRGDRRARAAHGPGQPRPQQGAAERRAPLRGRRPPRVLDARDQQRPGPGPVREGRGAAGRRLPRGGQPDAPAAPAVGPVQEQQRRQGEQLRLPRELPGGPERALRAVGGGADPVPGFPHRLVRVRARWGPRTAPSPAPTRSPSGPISSRR